MILKKMHIEIKHFGEAKTLVEIKECFFWHDKTNFVKEFVKVCDKCQLAKQIDKMKYGVEGMKIILVCDVFYWVTLDTVGPLTETFSGNKYVLVAIDHYSKWCETRFMKKTWCSHYSHIPWRRNYMLIWSAQTHFHR